MKDFGIYNPISLTGSEMRELESKLAKANLKLAPIAFALYGDGVVRLEPDRLPMAELKRLRDEFKTSENTILSGEAFISMKILNYLESQVISATILLGHKYCQAFSQNKLVKLSFADCVQVCALAIYDAMYTFNGQTCLSTYVSVCMRNNLVNLFRLEAQRNGVDLHSVKLFGMINKMKENFGLSFDECFLKLQTELSLDNKSIKKLTRAPVEFVNVFDEFELIDRSSGHSMELEEVIANSGLNDLQISLVDAVLHNDRKYRSYMETQINPNNGLPYTRSWLSQLYQQACVKIRNTIVGKKPKKAA